MGKTSRSLADLALFRSLTGEEIRALDSRCLWCRVLRKHCIVERSEPSTDVFVVTAGALEVTFQTVSGREVLVRTIETGEFFGRMAAGDDQPHASVITATAEVMVARMPRSLFAAALHSHSDLCDQVLTSLAGQVRHLTTQIDEFTTLDIGHRLCAELLRLAHPQPGMPGCALISPPPLHAQLAARVSARREAVTLQLKRLEGLGLLERRHDCLVLTDTTLLRAMIRSPEVFRTSCRARTVGE